MTAPAESPATTFTRLIYLVVQLDVPVSAFMATQKDDMRKPEIGMWEFFVREGNGGTKPGLRATVPMTCGATI